jgi:hypothetical protein
MAVPSLQSPMNPYRHYAMSPLPMLKKRGHPCASPYLGHHQSPKPFPIQNPSYFNTFSSNNWGNDKRLKQELITPQFGSTHSTKKQFKFPLPMKSRASSAKRSMARGNFFFPSNSKRSINILRRNSQQDSFDLDTNQVGFVSVRKHLGDQLKSVKEDSKVDIMKLITGYVKNRNLDLGTLYFTKLNEKEKRKIKKIKNCILQNHFFHIDGFSSMTFYFKIICFYLFFKIKSDQNQE